MATETLEPRVYTDERFPTLRIVNQGDVDFTVYEDGLSVDAFVAYEKPGVMVTSEPFAQRRASAYFDRIAKASLRPEFQDEQPEEVPIKSFDRFKAQPHGAPANTGNPLSGMREMTQQDVDDIIARASAEPDPAKAEALKKQALSMMQQQESAAQKIVRTLLSL